MTISATPVLACTGFHRSATSVTAQWLARAGLPMWLWEMGAQPSNPGGHFEDWAAVGLHDALLAGQGLDWQFADGAPWFPEAGIEAIGRYVARRDAHADGGPWGMKDPRTCLFLPAWHEALGERGRYLFILRHWAGCVDSLLRRHSAALATQPVPRRQHLAFWEQPLLAARMWLAYNRRLLAFAQAHPERVLLVTQKRLFDAFDLPTTVRDRLGVPLQPVESPVRPALLSEQLDGHVAELIPEDLQTELNQLWQALLEACEYKSDDESVSWREPTEAGLPDWGAGVLGQASARDGGHARQEPPYNLAGRLESLLSSGDKSANVRAMFDAIEQQAPFDAALWEKLASVALRNSRWEVAKDAMARVMSFGELHPYHSMMLGDVQQGVGDERAASVLYQQACRRNPKNAQFHARFARLRMLQGRHAEAEEVLVEGLGHFDDPPGSLLVLWCECLEQQGRRAEAIDWVRARDKLADAVSGKLAVMEMTEGLPSGEERLRFLEVKRISGLDRRAVLEKILLGVVDHTAREDLVRRICRVWERNDG